MTNFVQLRWNPFSLVAMSSLSLMTSSDEQSGSFRQWTQVLTEGYDPSPASIFRTIVKRGNRLARPPKKQKKKFFQGWDSPNFSGLLKVVQQPNDPALKCHLDTVTVFKWWFEYQTQMAIRFPRYYHGFIIQHSFSFEKSQSSNKINLGWMDD